MDALSSRAIVGEGTPETAWQAWLVRHPLSTGDVASLVQGSGTVQIVAPHPDDEILSCAGIMRQLARQGTKIQVWAVTDGEASHPGSRRWQAALLAGTRTRESERALQLLSVRVRRRRLAIPDGAVARHEQALAAALAASFDAGDTVIAPWRLDGHPDHEAVARASLQAAAARGCRFLEVPIWGWHWADPRRGDFPAHRALTIALPPADLAAKARAIRAFRTQLESDPDTGSPPILPAFALARLQRPFEVVLQ
ncbi:PIG-L deacetylase family protein [Bordetella sp. BOR01]|uniref:PIG-L deacetylase family protein n=1 Tax=Bordetella sp. BOR01 TaxID=2854779 RepID=UPI001C459ADA|nr:PIG-L family deacetylase [Bordetella sp. BOR01]MBV7481394.1 PIG-L family deacetylase [Bordetella sp. BOR01]